MRKARREVLAGLAGVAAWSGLRVPLAFAQGPAADGLHAGPDRTLMLGGTTWLVGQAPEGVPVRWRQVSGPGRVRFSRPRSLETTATVTVAGDYVLELVGPAGSGLQPSRLRLRAEARPPRERLDVVYTRAYSLDSPLWSARAKVLITRWLPHCIEMLERTDLPTGGGGLDNFIEAGKALRGEAHGAHKGYVFSNAFVHQTVEAICIALMVDARGDEAVLASQARLRDTLERWIPVILAAQEPDGYLQTAYTLADRREWPERWSPRQRPNHEGYVAGYFIESAINHYTLTGGSDRRLYDGARRLADCWVANIGPGRKEWYDGHQEMEQALVRFGRFVNDMEGQGRGDAYIALARFLLDSRRGGSEYDQSHAPPARQYEAVGHAVRATYFYSGMADIAAEDHDIDYQGAVKSLWDSIVNRKLYVTGGIGSGETSEGFGPDHSLPNDAYCESCSSCGLVFFQYKLNLAYHDARYADLYEQTLYNALLGATDLDGTSFTYTNPLVNTERARWHECPCCVSNITRTLLMVPTWAYARGRDALYVNLFIGSRVDVGTVAGTEVEMVQATDYPWLGKVTLTVNPRSPARFALHVRVPDRRTSALYDTVPAVSGLSSLAVNGKAAGARIVDGYAVIDRRWQAGDRVEFELPLEPQRLVPDARIAADAGRIAIARGPLVYNVETTDNGDIARPIGPASLGSSWRPDLLGGVVAVTGQWADGRPLLAVPHYARMNRTGHPPADFPGKPDPAAPVQSQVWIASG